MIGSAHDRPFVYNEVRVFTSHSQQSHNELREAKPDNSWQFTVSIDTGSYPETKNGYSKQTYDNLACIRIGPVFIMWGRNEYNGE